MQGILRANPTRAVRVRASASRPTPPPVTRRTALLSGAAALLSAGAAPALASSAVTGAHSPYFKGPDDIVFITATQAVLENQGVETWPTWEHGVDTFPYEYNADEDCFFISGRVVVTPVGGIPVTITAGDYVTFPAHMKCTWQILEPVKKHYKEYF